MISVMSLFGQKTVAVVVAKDMNVLYAGIPNPISIESSVSLEKLVISWGGGVAKEIKNNEYEVDVPLSFINKEITINISEKLENGELQQISSATYRVKSVPSPLVFIGEDVNSDIQEKDIILANPFISVKMSPDFIYELNWEVISYRVIFIIKGMEEAPIVVKGAKFNEKLIEKIRNAPSGSTVIFADIRVQSNTGAQRNLAELALRLR